MTKESTSHNKHEQQVRQENLLLFCGMAFMAAGPVFWYLAGMALDARALSLGPGRVDVLEWVSIVVSLLLSLSGAALGLVGWGLASWHAWRAIRQPRGM